MKYRPEVDGLRALAVLPVMFFHAGFEMFSGGFIGVDVFFVISGYLITTIIMSEMTKDKFSLLNFYVRRIRRIFPALIFVMLAVIPVSWALLLPRDMKDFSQSLVSTTFFLSNVLFWLEADYFDTASELKPLLHTWSLAVEEQYYIFFPGFMILVWKYYKKYLITLLLLIALLSLAASHWYALTDPTYAFYMIHTRLWELLIGAIVAVILFERDSLYPRKSYFRFFGLLGKV